jgi:hypothetical protein
MKNAMLFVIIVNTKIFEVEGKVILDMANVTSNFGTTAFCYVLVAVTCP